MSKDGPPDLPGSQDSALIGTRSGDFVEKRRRRFDDIKLLCKNNLPLHLEKLLSIIEMNTGMTRKTAAGFIMPLSDCGFLTIDQDSIVRVKE